MTTFIVCPSYCYKIFHPLIKVLVQEYDVITHIFDDVCNLESKNILLFGYQHVPNLQDLLKNNHVCVYNLEQLVCGKWDPYLHDLKDAYEIWDYSSLNIEYLTNYFPHLRVCYVPIGYSDHFRLKTDNIFPTSTNYSFIGNLSPRRKMILDLLGDSVEIYNHHYFEELDEITQKHETFINLHFYEPPTILETTRILPLLSNEKIIITEPSDDRILDKMFEHVIFFHNFSDPIPPDLTFSQDAFEEFKQNHHWKNYLTQPIRNITCDSFAIATLHCNDRVAFFEVIHSFVRETDYRDFRWVVLSQGCSYLHNEAIKDTFKSYGISYDLIEIEENMGWSKGMNLLYQHLQENDYKIIFHLEDDWLCDDISNKDWLFDCQTYLQTHPHVSTLFLRKYLSNEEKNQYGWTNHIFYKCFVHPCPFNYAAKIIHKEKEPYKSLVFREIPEFLYSANPTIFRLDDYVSKGVFPFPEFEDTSNKQEEWSTTTNEDAQQWGWAEAISMEKTRDLICMNVNKGFFFHRG
jgi:hypothetical protein